MLYQSLGIDSPSQDAPEVGPNLRITALRSRAVLKFLDSSRCATTAFCRPDVLKTLLITFERSLLALGMYRGKKLEGVALLLVQRKGPLGIVQRLPIRYAGLVLDPASAPGYLKRLKEHLASIGIGKAYYSFSPWASPDPEQLQALGYTVHEASTMVLPVDSSNVFSVADRRVRESVRSAERHGVRVLPATETQMRELLPDFLEQTYARRSMRSPYPRAAGSVIWQRHHSDPSTRVALALQHDDPLGIMVTVMHKERAYSWIIARDYTRAVNLNVNAVLVYDAAQWAAEKHATELDLGGGPPGIKEFKRRLGAEELAYIEAHTTHPLYVPVFRLWSGIKTHM